MHSRKDVGRCLKRPKNIVFTQRGTKKTRYNGCKTIMFQ
jgi:hypothetical protein